jgi:hypothetical protein
MHLHNISKEYAAANRFLFAIIIILLTMPFASILYERLNHSPFSLMTLNCFVTAQTGEPCPTCGLTRSIRSLYKDHFQESIVQYSYGYLFVLLLITQLFLRIVPRLSSRVWIPYIDIAQMIFCGVAWHFLSNAL